jgi:hypothetical protein
LAIKEIFLGLSVFGLPASYIGIDTSSPIHLYYFDFDDFGIFVTAQNIKANRKGKTPRN